MRDDIQKLRDRTKAFALQIIAMFTSLPRSRVAYVLGDQAFRAGTSFGAHYREAYRSRSDAEIISKLEAGLQELDETAYWLELLEESAVVPVGHLAALQKEADELTAIFVTIVKNIKARSGR